MTTETIRGFLRKQPFAPFVIHTSDGRKFEIKHPDFVAMHPEASAEVIVFLPKGRFEFVYLRNVTTVASEGNVPPRTRRPRRDDDAE
jgi:hypothetical protein